MQSQEISPDGRQSFSVANHYRQILRTNLETAIKARGWSIARPPPVHYLGGPKRGRKVGARTIQYMLEPDGPAVTLDVLVAVAVALGLQPWELLAPNLSLDDRPALSSRRAVEAEVSRRVAERMQTLQGQVARLLGDQVEAAGRGNNKGGSGDAGERSGGKAPSPSQSKTPK